MKVWFVTSRGRPILRTASLTREHAVIRFLSGANPPLQLTDAQRREWRFLRDRRGHRAEQFNLVKKETKRAQA